MTSLAALRRELRGHASAVQARKSASFSKTGAGEYAEGDRFLGVRVPVQRAITRRFFTLPLRDLRLLLQSSYHEERHCALFILVDQYRRSKDEAAKARIVAFYLRNAERVNNWGLVDSSAPHILGDWLLTHPRGILQTFARSRNLWKQRIAVVATLTLIRHGEVADTLRLARLFLTHEHDLMHKAVGWMLREVGDRDRAVAEQFLRQHVFRMPRTMLRYAIEHFPDSVRKQYLSRTKLRDS